ncbi:MAG: hypothetical protein J5867_05055, partial [Prevotella sp.]|nr:hypothetical protein [Prevotella sp.]
SNELILLFVSIFIFYNMSEISTAKLCCFSEMNKHVVENYAFFYSYTLVWKNKSWLCIRIQNIVFLPQS